MVAEEKVGTSEVDDAPSNMDVDNENAVDTEKDALVKKTENGGEEDKNEEKMETEEGGTEQKIEKETETPITESTCAEVKGNVDEDKLDGASTEKSKSDETTTESSKKNVASENSEEKTDMEVDTKDDTTKELEKEQNKKAKSDEGKEEKSELKSKDEDNQLEHKTPEKVKKEETLKEEVKSETKENKTDDASKKPMLKLASIAEMTKVKSPCKNTTCINYKATGCSQCFKKIEFTINAVVWETMQFCDEKCLALYQNKMNRCSTCKKVVNVGSLGKYCVRFGSDVKQFCSNVCLEEHKKGLKVCCYCQKNITGMDGFMAPIGGKGQFKDFCAPKCLQKYQELHGTKKAEKEVACCAVCGIEKTVEVKLILLPSYCKNKQTTKSEDGPKQSEEEEDEELKKFKKNECEEDASMAFDLPLESPEKAKKEKSATPTKNETEDDKTQIKEEKITPKKQIAEYDEYNKQMVVKFCSQACFSAYQFSHSADEGVITEPCGQCKTPFQRFEEERENTDEWLKEHAKDVHVIFYKAMCKRFCCSACQNVYVMQNREIVPCMSCKVRKYNFDMIEKHRRPENHPSDEPIPSETKPAYFCSTNCLKLSNINKPSTSGSAKSANQTEKNKQSSKTQSTTTESEANRKQMVTPPPPKIEIHTQTVTNTVKETLVKLPEAKDMKNKAIMTKPFMMTKGVSCRPHPCHKQTQSDFPSQPALVPVPVPTYMPVPLSMYQKPYPVPTPVPLPIPVPIVVPTTRNSYKGILRQVSKIRSKMPTDPFEAEMLALAGGVDHDPGEDSDDSMPDTSMIPLEDENSRNVRKSKALLELPPPTQDLEKELKGDKVHPKKLPQVTANLLESEWEKRRQAAVHKAVSNAPNSANNPNSNKDYGSSADSKHHLKFTYGLNAFKRWVAGKNAEIEKERAQGKYRKPFQSDISKLRTDELNYSLCLFVKEVKKPDGESYNADSLLYLCLGIQEYLIEKGRADNIFTDQYYESFTAALHEVAKDFKLPKNDLGYIVTRITEEQLWEAKQLGAHSPQVLLYTMAYFNTKYFMMRTIEDHQKLGYTQIVKHWKQGQMQGQKSGILRYTAPARKGNKTYEQHENTENALRCPVKLYEFYLSKCPEPSKQRNDAFYLEPLKTCQPDSNLWFSNAPLPPINLDKMLSRNMMVREVQEHILAEGP